MCQAVFSSVATKYIPTTNTLGDSIKKQHLDLPFYIVITDSEDGIIQFDQQQYPILLAVQLGIEKLAAMSFKYAVTEFCMVLSPFAFQCPSKQNFDSAIYTVNQLSPIFNWLKNMHMHIVQNQVAGLVPGEMLLSKATADESGLNKLNEINPSRFEGEMAWLRRVARRARLKSVL